MNRKQRVVNLIGRAADTQAATLDVNGGRWFCGRPSSGGWHIVCGEDGEVERVYCDACGYHFFDGTDFAHNYYEDTPNDLWYDKADVLPAAPDRGIK